ncbi:ATP-binding cassette domain-containing protein [Leifsonia sp. YIM 134122]|uniref:ATP-binding cassette domain-containing protein n=1 Tax=Leifsonia stereocauli TaxID=3134136 RepID=A0ABU9W7D1_9MICO
MLRFRSAPLKAAAFLAVGFIALRLAYRALFNGLGGSGLVLVDLPALRLPPPFAHVALFGPITTGGIQVAIESALPIAAVILAFGVLNAFVDVSRLFARGARRGPFRSIARALVIAWATYPGLTDAVTSVRRARRLRAERGLASLLVPIFERTIERAVAVAATMEVRGFAATSPVDGGCDRPVVLRDLSIRFDGRRMLHASDLSLSTGTLTVIAGATGSGKSSLLNACSGLLSHVDGGEVNGLIEIGGVDRLAVPPRDTARFVGVVLQQPRLGFASESVADEIGFALDVRGVAPVIVAARVREVAERLGIADLVGRDIRALSAGEATLVSIAAAVIQQPTLLLVDEPLADLDSDARERIAELLGALAHEAGVCVVVAEHRVGELAHVADEVLSIEDGELRRASSSAAPSKSQQRGAETAASTPTPTGAAAAAPLTATAAGATIARITAVSVSHAALPAVIDASFSLAAGEIVAITGPNGAGKSSLLGTLALPATPGTVVIDGADVVGLPARLRRMSVALVPDASDDLLFSTTVAEECRRADRSADVERGTTQRSFEALLGSAPGDLSLRHPRDLSTGERRLLAIAIQLAAAPRVLLVDEPTRGLDGLARAQVARALRTAAASGCSVVIASHDRAFAAEVADRALEMRAGRLGDASTADSVRASANDDLQLAEVPQGRDRSASSTAQPNDASTVDSVRASANDDPPLAEVRRSRDRSASSTSGHTARTTRWQPFILVAGSLLAAAAFAWPLLVPALPAQAQAAAPFAAIALLPFVIVAVALSLDGAVRSAKTLALLGTLTAIGAAVRIASTGVGGVEALFVLLILAGRVFGARFGFLLGILTIALSSTMWGGFGPWTPFQMFACGWVGAGAGLLPRFRMPHHGRALEITALAVYGALASYAFGLIMNLWFWPFAVGTASDIAYVPGASVAQNASSFLLYSLVTSTLTWDTLRAVTSVVGIVVAGPAILAALRRAKVGPSRSIGTTRRSTSPRGGGTRTRRSTAPDAAAVPPTAPLPSARA